MRVASLVVLAVAVASCAGSPRDVGTEQAASTTATQRLAAAPTETVPYCASADVSEDDTGPTGLLEHGGLEWVYVGALTPLSDLGLFASYFPDREVTAVRIDDVTVVAEAGSTALVPDPTFPIGAEPIAFFGPQAQEGADALATGSRLLLGVIRMVGRDGEVIPGLAAEDRDEFQFVINALAVAADGSVRELGLCGADEFGDVMTRYIATRRTAGDAVTAIEVIEAILGGDEDALADLREYVNPPPVPWSERPPSQRNIDPGQTPPEIYARFTWLNALVAVPDWWLRDEAWRSLCTYTPQGWGSCQVLRAGIDQPFLMTIYYEPGSGDGAFLVLAERGDGFDVDRSGAAHIDEARLASTDDDVGFFQIAIVVTEDPAGNLQVALGGQE